MAETLLTGATPPRPHSRSGRRGVLAPAVTVAPGVPALPEIEYVAAGVVTVPVTVKLPAA